MPHHPFVPSCGVWLGIPVRIRCGRCRVNMAHIRQSRPDYGPGSQGNHLKTVEVVPSSLGSVWRSIWGSIFVGRAFGRRAYSAQRSQSRPIYGLDLSHFQDESLSTQFKLCRTCPNQASCDPAAPGRPGRKLRRQLFPHLNNLNTKSPISSTKDTGCNV